MENSTGCTLTATTPREAVLNDLRSWAPKLKRGGLLVGDDFQWRDEAGDFSVVTRSFAICR